MKKANGIEHIIFLELESERRRIEFGMAQRLEVLQDSGMNWEDAVEKMSDEFAADGLRFVERKETFWEGMRNKYNLIKGESYLIKNNHLIEIDAKDVWHRKAVEANG